VSGVLLQYADGVLGARFGGGVGVFPAQHGTQRFQGPGSPCVSSPIAAASRTKPSASFNNAMSASTTRGSPVGPTSAATMVRDAVAGFGDGTGRQAVGDDQPGEAQVVSE
jgi:hypothetical protein